jgi:hypothetical protein
MPNVRTAFKLAVIYKTYVRDLYGPLFQEVEKEVEATRNQPNSFQNPSH